LNRRFAGITPDLVENVRTGEKMEGWLALSRAAGLLSRGEAGACRRWRPDPIAHFGMCGGIGTWEQLSVEGKCITPQRRRCSDRGGEIRMQIDPAMCMNNKEECRNLEKRSPFSRMSRNEGALAVEPPLRAAHAGLKRYSVVVGQAPQGGVFRSAAILAAPGVPIRSGRPRACPAVPACLARCCRVPTRAPLRSCGHQAAICRDIRMGVAERTT